MVDVERYSKVEICFLGLARKRLLFLLRQEERVIDGNIGQNRGRDPRAEDSDETGRQGNSKRFLAKNSQKVALGEGAGGVQVTNETRRQVLSKRNLPNTIDRRTWGVP